MTDPCPHVGMIREVTPSALGCEECLKTGSPWVHLRICRTCGNLVTYAIVNGKAIMSPDAGQPLIRPRPIAAEPIRPAMVAGLVRTGNVSKSGIGSVG